MAGAAIVILAADILGNYLDVTHDYFETMMSLSG
jgi:hypothetical protein